MNTIGRPFNRTDWLKKLPWLERVQALKTAIWQKRPILGAIMQRHGNDTLYDYSRDFLDVNKSPRLDERKNEVISVAEDLITKRLGAQVAKKVSAQLTKYPLVSTIDHHSPIQHPFWVNTNIISALPYQEHNDPILQNLVVFSFSGVSLNNESGFPRGVMFHGGNGGDGAAIRVPLLPDKMKMSTVYSSRGYTRDDITRAQTNIDKKVREGVLLKDRAEHIKKLVGDYFGHAADKFADLNSQITYLNYFLWPKLFHPDRKTGAGQASVPNLIYLEIETLVKEILLRHHLRNPNSLIYKILFNPKFESILKRNFNNIPGAFSFEHDWGTFFFWAVDNKQHRVRMFLNDRVLHSLYRNHEVDMEPEQVCAALEKGEIFPSMLMCYLTISLYYGFKCLGGFCQVNDLTKTKEAWMEVLKEIGEDAEVMAVAPVQTKELGGDGMALSYLADQAGEITPATGFDMILESPDTTMEHYIDLSRRVTLSEVMMPMLPEMYTVLYSHDDREPALLEINQRDLTVEAKLKEKLDLTAPAEQATVPTKEHAL